MFIYFGAFSDKKKLAKSNDGDESDDETDGEIFDIDKETRIVIKKIVKVTIQKYNGGTESFQLVSL